MSEHACRILLVEDNSNDVKLTLHAFESHEMGHYIQVVRDGAEALEFLFCTGRYAHRKFEDSPAVILLDLNLPLVDGFEVLSRIKKDPRTREIPVVVMTSSKDDCDVDLSYRLGVNSFIVKPVDFEEFSEVVRQRGLYWLLQNQPALKGV